MPMMPPVEITRIVVLRADSGKGMSMVLLPLLNASEGVVQRMPGEGDAVRQAGTLAVVDHRPWRLPHGPWLMAQTWLDLLFAHWRLAPERLSGVLPPGVEPDLFDGAAWIGVTPFEVTGLRLHGTAPAPLLSRFAETNVRTYVTFDGKPGIWFLSLDAASRLAVVSSCARTSTIRRGRCSRRPPRSDA